VTGAPPFGRSNSSSSDSSSSRGGIAWSFAAAPGQTPWRPLIAWSSSPGSTTTSVEDAEPPSDPAGAEGEAAFTAVVTAPKQPQEVGTHSFRMLLGYDGSAYSGWQLQPRAPTIQMHVERALTTVLREPRERVGVSAAGRTDAGVHAAGQVVQFRTDRPELVGDPSRLAFRLNSLLPHDIRVGWVAATAPDFNVTCTATGKVGAGGGFPFFSGSLRLATMNAL
jgi:hypothetical protein